MKTNDARAPEIRPDGLPHCTTLLCPRFSVYSGECSELDAKPERMCIPALRDMAMHLDAHEDASMPAFDEIVQLCGLAKTWEYPGQVIRDVRDALKQRDDKIAALGAHVRFLEADQLRLIKEREDAKQEARRTRTRHPDEPEKCPGCTWTNIGLMNYGKPGVPKWLCHGCAARTINELQLAALEASALDHQVDELSTVNKGLKIWLDGAREENARLQRMVDRGEQLRADAEEPEHLRLAKADTVWLQSAWETEIKRNEELQRRVTTAEAVRDDARAASQRYLDEKRKVQAELNTAKLAEAAQDQARENAAQAIQEMLVKLASERDSLRAAVRTEWLTNDQRAFLRNVLGRLVPPDSNGFDWSCFGTRVAEHAGSILAALPPSEPPASALYVRCVTHDVEPGHYCNFDDVCNERILAFKATAQIKDHTHERVCNHCGHSHPFSSDEDDIDTCPGCGNEANPVARGIRHATTGGQVSTCTCSEKYRELAPGVHAKYCPLAGQPLDGI